MPKLGLSTSLAIGNSGAIGAGVIWKVAIFGAGTDSSNGEYVWNGTTLENGKPKYFYGANYIEWNTETWVLFDSTIDDYTYSSSDLILWDYQSSEFQPNPSSALSYAQDSFISGITLIGANIEYANSDYARSMSGGVPFGGNAQADSTIYFTDEYDPPNVVARIYDGKDGLNMYVSNSAGSSYDVDLFHWNLDSDGSLPVPSVSAVVYSA